MTTELDVAIVQQALDAPAATFGTDVETQPIRTTNVVSCAGSATETWD